MKKKILIVCFILAASHSTAFAQEVQKVAPLRPVYVKGKWGYFSEGLLATAMQGETTRAVYLDGDGKVVLEIPFWQQRTAWQRALYTLRRQQLAPFKEGLAAVLSFNRLGFIDKTGKVVIEPEFRETNGFSEGLAAVKIIGSDGQYVWGYIDRKGHFVIEPRFKEAKSFAGGLAHIKTSDGKQQLIDKSGKVIWQAAK